MTTCARIYIAGPMSGLPNLNFDAFHDAADRFRRAAWIVENPVEIGREAFGPRPDAVSAHRFLQADMRRLIDCDAIALLPGWERSVGASAEAAMALALGLTFYDAETTEEIARPACLTVRSYAAPAPETPNDAGALSSASPAASEGGMDLTLHEQVILDLLTALRDKVRNAEYFARQVQPIVDRATAIVDPKLPRAASLGKPDETPATPAPSTPVPETQP